MTTQTEIVPVGEYRVSGDRAVTLLTVTASCVALVLFDPENRVGGMLHVVLPGHRKSLRKEDHETYFADTGVPFLVEEMVRQGARHGNLQATLVGGGRLLADDHEMDIGLENVVAVRAILETAGIPIIRDVTGGVKGRHVIFPVATGEVQIGPLSEKQTSFHGSPIRNATETSGEDLRNRMEHLRPNPTFSKMLFEALHHPPIDWDGVHWIVARDPVLSIHFFRHANSPYYGLPGEISSFQCALNRLGTKQVRRICILISAMRQSENKSDYVRIAETGLPRHTLSTAVIAGEIAAALPFPFADDAFAAGLLHGAECLESLFGGVAAADLSPQDSENSSCDPEWTSAALFSKWHFPQQIIDAVFIDGELAEDPNGLTTLGHLVRAACGISRALGMTTTLEPVHWRLDAGLLDRLKVKRDLSDILPGTMKRLKKYCIPECIR